MKVLVVGGGGREHALVWSLSASPLVTGLFAAPGNPGIASLATCWPIAADDVAALVARAVAEGVEFVVVGPEAPLVAGLVDALDQVGIKAFGPRAAAARLEGSKGFTKDLIARAGVPTAAYARFSAVEPARAYLRQTGAPIVVKADGLAAGKGVTVAMTLAEAEAAIEAALVDGRFGAAGAEVVIEEYLEGEEVSFFALCDGETALPLASAQDHKRAYDGDQGPNTGGMGAYSPAPALTRALEAEVMERIIRPTLATMAADGTPFTGVLFAGLMLTSSGPKLIEYNVRFGDPECQVLMARLQSDLLPALLAAADQQLRHVSLRWRPDPALCVVYAAEGYPDAPKKGAVLTGLDAAGATAGVQVFHAGTKQRGDALVADGGRVLTVTATAPTLATARDRAYQALGAIQFPGGFFRRDIGWRALG
ncbi:MAG: phosphoribosylamine--glycine ligase [Alphaproteobacteria bacterium]|nr:MAG: phosphoribosylamine--glycine ligase [Alphaproteobacteria bacterium]